MVPVGGGVSSLVANWFAERWGKRTNSPHLNIRPSNAVTERLVSIASLFAYSVLRAQRPMLDPTCLSRLSGTPRAMSAIPEDELLRTLVEGTGNGVGR